MTGRPIVAEPICWQSCNRLFCLSAQLRGFTVDPRIREIGEPFQGEVAEQCDSCSRECVIGQTHTVIDVHQGHQCDLEQDYDRFVLYK